MGDVGEVVRVKDGFARNYLLPQKRALRATKDKLAYFEAKKAEIEKRHLTAVEQARKLQRTLEGREVLAIRQASESGRLYGSVTTKDILALLGGEEVERSQIILSKPIREIGVYPLAIRIHAGVEARLLLNVARSEDEAKTQAAKHKPPEDRETRREAETEPAARIGEETGEAPQEPKSAKPDKNP